MYRVGYYMALWSALDYGISGLLGLHGLHGCTELHTYMPPDPHPATRKSPPPHIVQYGQILGRAI